LLTAPPRWAIEFCSHDDRHSYGLFRELDAIEHKPTRINRLRADVKFADLMALFDKYCAIGSGRPKNPADNGGV
jgi:hypothetical protein